MKHRHLAKSIALLVGIAALAVPAGAAGYPLIPDEPGALAQKLGQDFMNKRSKELKKITRHQNVTIKRNQTCPGKLSRVRCIKP